MDPQQRLMLEAAAWVIGACQATAGWEPSMGGVFVGSTHADFLVASRTPGSATSTFGATGSSLSVIPGEAGEELGEFLSLCLPVLLRTPELDWWVGNFRRGCCTGRPFWRRRLGPLLNLHSTVAGTMLTHRSHLLHIWSGGAVCPPGHRLLEQHGGSARCFHSPPGERHHGMEA